MRPEYRVIQSLVEPERLMGAALGIAESLKKMEQLKRKTDPDPIHCRKHHGWYFWDETWSDRIGPFWGRWETQKILDMYCFFEGGLGQAKPLYLDPAKAVAKAKDLNWKMRESK